MTLMKHLKSNYHVSNLNLANINAARTILIKMCSYDFTFVMQYSRWHICGHIEPHFEHHPII